MTDSSEAQVRGLTQALLTVPSEEREEARAAPRKKRRADRESAFANDDDDDDDDDEVFVDYLSAAEDNENTRSKEEERMYPKKLARQQCQAHSARIWLMKNALRLLVKPANQEVIASLFIQYKRVSNVLLMRESFLFDKMTECISDVLGEDALAEAYATAWRGAVMSRSEMQDGRLVRTGGVSDNNGLEATNKA